MDQIRLTDERLRTWLNGNQPARERLCLSVLSMNRAYRDCRPRRPEGGPDGGRDIECVHQGRKCFCAVGFVNSPMDSTAEITQIKKKFRDDVTAALNAESTLKHFVFFTNVDLRPSDVSSMMEEGNSLGLETVDIYHRERIRIALDSVEGFAVRYQYLSIVLSEPEQASFFGRFGKDLEQMVQGRLDRIERAIACIDHRRWLSTRIRSMNVYCELTQSLTAKEIGPFRFALELCTLPGNGKGMVIGAKENYSVSEKDPCFRVQTFFWQQGVGNIKDSWVPGGHLSVGYGTADFITADLRWTPESQIFGSMFDGLFATVYATENIAQLISYVELTVDHYSLLKHRIKKRFWTERPTLGWPEPLDEAQLSQWRCRQLEGLHLNSPLESRLFDD